MCTGKVWYTKSTTFWVKECSKADLKTYRIKIGRQFLKFPRLSKKGSKNRTGVWQEPWLPVLEFGRPPREAWSKTNDAEEFSTRIDGKAERSRIRCKLFSLSTASYSWWKVTWTSIRFRQYPPPDERRECFPFEFLLKNRLPIAPFSPPAFAKRVSLYIIAIREWIIF